MRNPIGIAVAQPRLSWQWHSNAYNLHQSAYQIRVATDSSSLKRGDRLLWNSGKKQTDQSVLVPYEGPILQSRKRYFWQVRGWTRDGEVTAWSKVGYWEMGLLDTTDWQAQWITTNWEEDDKSSPPAPFFRKPFTLKKNIASARLYITALGLYEAKINGQKVGNQLFTPGWTSYNHRLQYQVYDVTTMVQKGKNAIGVCLGDGWYRGYFGFRNRRNNYGKQLATLVQLEITYTSGKKKIITSDDTWHARKGPILSSDIYHGETYDARKELGEWSTAAYEMEDWEKVSLFAYPKSTLIASHGTPIRQTDVIQPIEELTTPNGEKVYDLGQNMVGRVRLAVEGNAGDTISLYHAEVLDKEGNFYTHNLRSARQKVTYILKGDGGEHYEPHFTFQGFRYVKVVASQTTKIISLSGIVIHSDMPATGTFSCSDTLVNQLQHNIVWGLKGNFLDVPTDCPQRDERLGWTGDAQVFSRTAAFNRQVAPFFAKWLQDLAADQQPNGRVPHVIPQVLAKRHAAAAGWADAAVIIPWNLYQTSGDKRLLERQYPSMKKWVDYVTAEAGEDYLWNTGTHFGDWLFYSVNDDRDGKSAITDKHLIAQAFFVHSADLLQKIASVLGKKAEATQYASLSTHAKAAFQKEYITGSGRLVSSTQTAYVLALAFGLFPDSLQSQAVNRLVENIKTYGHLTTGFLGTPHLCRVLSENGHVDLAYQLFFRKKYPSWLYPVTQGATTIWERWDGIRPDGTFQAASMNSFNHYAYGAIGDWMYQTIGGIRLDEAKPGYKHVVIAPQLTDSLEWASCAHQSMYGMIKADWAKQTGIFELEVTIPPNTTAEIRLPNANAAEVGILGSKRGTVSLSQSADFVTAKVGSGRYRFGYKY